MRTVLLLEDDVLSEALYRRVLERRGCRVLTASTPEEALRWCQSALPDLFVADNLLHTQMSGAQTLYSVRKCAGSVRLLLVSGTPPEGFDDHDFECFRALVKSRAFTFLLKPFTSEAFCRTAMELMEGSGDASKMLEDAIAFRRSRKRGRQRHSGLTAGDSGEG